MQNPSRSLTRMPLPSLQLARKFIAPALMAGFLGFAPHVLAESGSQTLSDPINQTLEKIYQDYPNLRFQGYESIETLPSPSAGGQKYMVLDFRGSPSLRGEELQDNIYRICMAVLKQQRLIQDLNSQGYDMISVAFDLESQYDCL